MSREKVFAYFALAKEEGAATVVGGGVPKFGDSRDAGAWIEPTVFTGLPENARCMREEIFGPACQVTPFDSEEQSIAMANDTDYGLAASVWTSNIDRGREAHGTKKITPPHACPGTVRFAPRGDSPRL